MVQKLKYVLLVTYILVVASLISCLYYSVQIDAVPSDYDCEERPGIISDSERPWFESRQHYVNRMTDATIKEIEALCG